MPSGRALVEREMQRLELRPFTLDEFHRRREQRERNRRIRAGVVALLVAAAGTGALVRAFPSGSDFAGDPRGPFLGSWVSTDGDGSAQTMTVGAPGGAAVEIVVHDDGASVCSGAPSTMTGAGRLKANNVLVIPFPVLTCDEGSEPEVPSGPPLVEQLRNLTFVYNPEADALTDNLGAVWERPGAEEPSPEPATPDFMWPQSSLEEVREAQELADAGDPRYTWQVDPGLVSADPWMYLRDGDAEIIARFLREELGWEEFLLNPFQGGDDPDASADGTFADVAYIRCAPGETNPLYPNGPWGAGGCAPTIDELRYEAVSLDVAQLGVRGPSGIWVVSRWAVIEPFAQLVPPTAEAAVLMEDFLQARIDGEGAERYVEVSGAWSAIGGVPLLYATTTGTPYERSEFERVDGPRWPFGDMEFTVRLFGEGGETVVEQRFFVTNEAGRLGLEYRQSVAGEIARTTENGQPVPVPYAYANGEVTMHAAYPWAEHFATSGLVLDNDPQDRLEVLGNPRQVETGCEQGPAPADAEALARSIRSDPDVEATAPVAVTVGGIHALRIDVVVASGATVCDASGAPQVLTENDHSWRGLGLKSGHRMRLYMLDLPEGSSTRILAIAIVGPEARFERVLEAATPVVDSFEFHAR